VAFPYWKNPWYWALFLVFIAIASYLLAHHLIRKKIQLHLRQAQIIADERLRIARDLHDDLGARLSHISLLGSHAAGSTRDADTQQTFRQITSMSRELITSLSETVWMLNSKNDRLESLINYLCRMVSELCKSLDIRCRIDAESPPEDQPVNHEVRHHVTMAVKEAVNNALKHSHCTEIRLSVHLQPTGLHISIADNGIGLTAEGSEQGNGLENIRQRMSALNGRTEILESDQGGVIVHLHVPV
jgi:signal transduction histidine kinase